jgi:hypothetical protein
VQPKNTSTCGYAVMVLFQLPFCGVFASTIVVAGAFPVGAFRAD